MAVDQQRTVLVQKSLKQHIIAVLAAENWPSPGDFVDIGSIDKETDEVPVVGIPAPEITGDRTEIGSNIRRHTYLVDIEVKAQTGGQLTALMDIIGDNVNNVPIIDFNVAETTDPAYDADAQTVARGQVLDRVRRRVFDDLEHSGRVSFRMRESKAF